MSLSYRRRPPPLLLSRCRLDRSPCQASLWLIFPPSATLQVRCPGSYLPLVEVLQVQRNGGFTYLKQNCSKQSRYKFFQKMLYTLFVHTCFYSSLIKVRLSNLKKSGLIPDPEKNYISSLIWLT